MRVLVTGGGGFLGQYLVRALLARGDRPRVMARGEYPALAALGAECQQGDVRHPEQVERAVQGCEAVLHVASRVGYWGPLREYREINIQGTANLLQACKRAGVQRLVYTSTPSVVLGKAGCIEGGDESLPLAARHLTAYAATKAQAEAAVLAADAPELATAAIRPHFIFGPGDPQIVPRILERARRGKLVRIGDGSNQVDVTYVDNCVDAHLGLLDALAERGAPARGRAYFIGQEQPVRLWDFVDSVLTGFGAPRPRRHISVRAAYALGAVVEAGFRALGLQREPPLTRSMAIVMGTSHYFSHARASRDFGYRPRVSTAEALARVFAAGEPSAP